MANNISRQEIMVGVAAREIKDNEVSFIGTGLPMIAAYLAKFTHGKNSNLLFESGIIDSKPQDLATGVGDFTLLSDCTKTSGLFYALGLLQRGKIDLGFLGGAEVDQYGNINSTVIGDYFNPKVRLPGSGGANDIASLAKRTVIIVPHQKRKFPKKINYITTPGYLDGPGARAKAGLEGGGPKKVITDLAVLGFDDKTKKMKLETTHPGVSIKEVKEKTGFELLIPDKVPNTELPTPEEVELIRLIDQKNIYLKY